MLEPEQTRRAHGVNTAMGPDLRLAAAALPRLGETVMLLYEKLSCGTAVCLTTAARSRLFPSRARIFPRC